jgi:hypothetical protein
MNNAVDGSGAYVSTMAPTRDFFPQRHESPETLSAASSRRDPRAAFELAQCFPNSRTLRAKQTLASHNQQQNN